LTEKVDLSSGGDVLIIGGGISGITAALELAQSGIPLTLVERESSLGGLAASFCCKASESCNKCFACVVDKRISEIHQRRDISVLTQTEVAGVKNNGAKYQVALKRGTEKINLEVSAVVIAAGINPFDAPRKAEYGYGRYKDVITAKDLDEMLRFHGALSRPSDGKLPKRTAFFQCVGSRDESVGNLYCSQVCCAYALRLIKTIRHQYPEVKATFLYTDIQPAGAFFQKFLDSCRLDRGIRLIRSLPSKVYYSPLSNTLSVRFIDPEKEEVVEDPFDLIVLSVGMVLSNQARPLTALFGLDLTKDGFIASPPRQSGVFVTGACHGPKDIDRSILHAKSVAFLVQQHLRGRA